MTEKPLKILIAASEAEPFAKTGGLADVAGALPKALKKAGHDVRVIMPWYKMIQDKEIETEIIRRQFRAEWTRHGRVGTLRQLAGTPDFPVYFIEKDEVFYRPELYGTPYGDYDDNEHRFIFFAQAILSALEIIDWRPDVIHCNDWQTGLVPVYLRNNLATHPFFNRIGTLFTIHNIAYQGNYAGYAIRYAELDENLFTLSGLEFYGQFSFIKGGMVFSDAVTTVSKKYAEEIMTEEFGYGLEGILKARTNDLHGVLNGVDYDVWNPETDKLIPANYSIKDLSGKKKCKEALLKEFGLPANRANKPTIGVISRLADQKGFDLLAQIIDEIIELDVNFVLLGTGEKKYHDLFERIGMKYPKQAGIRIAYDNKLAHIIEAGSDMFLMPSRYEPCGLNQIYSLKYGAIPLVRATGGLDDTIAQFDPKTKKGNGFKFGPYDAMALLDTIKEAVSAFKKPKLWKELVTNAMACDFSWEQSAKEYVRLYRGIAAKY